MQNDVQCCANKLNYTEEGLKDTLPPSLQTSIHNIVEREGYITYTVSNRTLAADGGNYMATLYEIDIKGQTKDGEKETNLFVKNAISADGLKDVISVNDVYLTESFVYNDLSNIFTELQDEANIPVEERYKILKGFNESNCEAIILENAAKRGFKTPDRMEIPPLKFVQLSVQQLAKFHALSFVIQKKRPEYFAKKVATLVTLARFNDEWTLAAENFAKITIRKLEGEDGKRAEEFIPKCLKEYPEYLTDTKSAVRCLCHGDFRANNILMKKIEGEVTEVIPIDYQNIYYGCPINDFINFTFGCTDRKLRLHLDCIKDIYHNTIRDYLALFNMDVNHYYPRKAFEEAYKERLSFGLMTAMLSFPLMYASSENIPDCGKVQFSKIDVTLQDCIYERFKELFDDMVEWGCL